ncbi:hypothetical protein D3C81_1251660 [compost metagenome]
MQPALQRQAHQLRRQLGRFTPLHLRIPDRINASCEPFEAVFQRLHGSRVVLLVFVRRVDQHQRATRRGRQDGLDAIEAVAVIEHDLAARAAEIVAQHLDLGAVQLEQPQAVLIAQHLPCQPWGTGVVAQVAVRVLGAHLVQEFVQKRG